MSTKVRDHTGQLQEYKDLGPWNFQKTVPMHSAGRKGEIWGPKESEEVLQLGTKLYISGVILKDI